MFTQTDNPFGEIMPVSYSPVNTEYISSNKSSNIWKFILGISILIGGVLVYFLRQKNEEAEAAKIESQKVESGLNQNENV